jgi:hypothetical protein
VNICQLGAAMERQSYEGLIQMDAPKSPLSLSQIVEEIVALKEDDLLVFGHLWAIALEEGRVKIQKPGNTKKSRSSV